jgi:putative ABC transport system permease protein
MASRTSTGGFWPGPGERGDAGFAGDEHSGNFARQRPSGNTISAVLVQQTRQIGIMRSVGATRRQMVQMYLAYVLVLSFIGLLVALPVGMLGARGLLMVGAHFVNYNISTVDLPPGILLLQAGLGLAMPLAVALLPILRGTRLSVYDAIYQNGLGNEDQKGWLERQLLRLRKLSPPVMLSLRNTSATITLAFTLYTDHCWSNVHG